MAVVKLKNIEIKLDSDLAIKNLSLKIDKGEFVYLIGKTGSGKSSILKALYSEKKIICGEAKIGQTDLKQLKENEIPFLRRKIGIIFQDFKLLKDRNVFKNLEFVLKATGWNDSKIRKEKIESCLNKVHILDLINKFPNQLSGGQKQKVAIARALLNDPEIILADEPTGNLDPISSIEVMNVLREINESGNTILMATHDFSLLEKFKGRIIVCRNGEISEMDYDKLKIEKVYA
jgi:cell division transport system ATP-binding protein